MKRHTPEPAIDVAKSPIATIEPRLRDLLPADLYAKVWIEPSKYNLIKVFDHLRTLHRSLINYVPRHVTEMMLPPGQVQYDWEEGTLMFTDLAGFTPLMEANAARGRDGAKSLLGVLNDYFASMIEIINKSGGTLLEFTGDALLAMFPKDERNGDTAQAVRAGLRMQRAMARFAEINTEQGTFSLGMRIGLHCGEFMRANIGTPRRMDHVLLGSAVQLTKLAEGAGVKGRVCLSEDAYSKIANQFTFEDGKPGYKLVVDSLSGNELGEFDIDFKSRRLASAVLMDQTEEGLVTEISQTLPYVESLATYLPLPILDLLIESSFKRDIPPDFLAPTVCFVNLLGLSEALHDAGDEGVRTLITAFSRIFTQADAVVEARGGVLKKVTYHLSGSDMMIYFGAPQSHSDDPIRAVEAAVAIRDMIAKFPPITVNGVDYPIVGKVGLARGSVFAAEIGEKRGRREFNILGDCVNTAARLMARADDHTILITGKVADELDNRFELEDMGQVQLKGKAAPVQLYKVIAQKTVEK